MEYDGTDFVGWQTQPNGRSVQEEITKVLDQVLQESVNVIGAGRTDSGVHARGQVANLRTNSTLSTGAVLNALGGLLPEDICVYSVEEVPEDFHARYSARERLYRYYISFKPSAIGRRYQWYVKYDLDFEILNSIATQVVGEHDFESFCKADSAADSFVCTVNTSAWMRAHAGLIYEVRANRFLRGMVRALVGTMVDIARGFTPPEEFPRILTAKDRRKAGLAAPAQGLFLEEVLY
jgi:tRNA pseudouridine38-40 synthase